MPVLPIPNCFNPLKERRYCHYIKNADVREIISRMLTCLKKNNTLNVRNFVETLEKEDLRSLVLDAAFDSVPESADEPEKVFFDYFKHIERQFFKEESKKITEKLSEAERKGDEEAIKNSWNRRSRY